MNEKEALHTLYQAIINIENESECVAFLDDLLSKHELESLASRVYSAKLLQEGKTYLETIAEVKLSSATLARVSKCVKNGVGYNTIIPRLKEKEEESK